MLSIDAICITHKHAARRGAKRSDTGNSVRLTGVRVLHTVREKCTLSSLSSVGGRAGTDFSALRMRVVLCVRLCSLNDCHTLHARTLATANATAPLHAGAGGRSRERALENDVRVCVCGAARERAHTFPQALYVLDIAHCAQLLLRSLFVPNAQTHMHMYYSI